MSAEAPENRVAPASPVLHNPRNRPTPDLATVTIKGLCHGLLRSGALAGAGAALVFTALHHATISNIWFSVVPMLLAGAACGTCVAWSYGRLFTPPGVATWLRYNLVFTTLFVVLGVVSLLVFEPVTTIPALLAANAPPRDLIREALPLTIGFILVSAGLIHWWRGRNLLDAVAILVTCAVLIVLLGVNISILGLIFLPVTAGVLVAKVFGLILALNAAYVAFFLALERRQLFGQDPHAAPPGAVIPSTQGAIDEPGA